MTSDLDFSFFTLHFSLFCLSLHILSDYFIITKHCLFTISIINKVKTCQKFIQKQRR